MVIKVEQREKITQDLSARLGGGEAGLVPRTHPLPEGRKNAQAKEDITHLPPEQLAASILEKEHRIVEIVGTIQRLLEKKP